MLQPAQFKHKIAEKVANAYDKRANKFLDRMDQRGESTRVGMEAQLANWEKAWKDA